MSYGFSVVVAFALVVVFALLPVVVVVFVDVVVLVLVADVVHEAAAVVVVVAAIGFDGDGSSEISLSDFERGCLSAMQTPNRCRRRKLKSEVFEISTEIPRRPTTSCSSPIRC